MTHTRPRRRTVRQCMQIFFTEAFTFMCIGCVSFLYPADPIPPPIPPAYAGRTI